MLRIVGAGFVELELADQLFGLKLADLLGVVIGTYTSGVKPCSVFDTNTTFMPSF